MGDENQTPVAPAEEATPKDDAAEEAGEVTDEVEAADDVAAE